MQPSATSATVEVPIKEAKSRAAERGVTLSERTLHRWAARGWIKARRLASGHGMWLVQLDHQGLPVDGSAA